MLPQQGRDAQAHTGRRRQPQQGETHFVRPDGDRSRPPRRQVPARTARQEEVLPAHSEVRFLSLTPN